MKTGLENLDLWKYFGEEFKTAVLRRFEVAEPMERAELVDKMGQLDAYCEEMLAKHGQDGFLFVLQKALTVLTEDLRDQAAKLRRDFAKLEEEADQIADQKMAETMIDNI